MIKFLSKTLRLISGVITLCFLLQSQSCTSKVDEKKTFKSHPNIIVIFADDLGYGDIGCYGAKGIKTPELDALATGGFRSTDFFIPANVCSPSRASLLTGRYPMRNGYPVASNEQFPKYDHYPFHPDELTIPEVLKPAGYSSLIVGKWHLGIHVKDSHPLDAGFDEYFGIPSNYGRNNTLFHNRDTVAKEVDLEMLTKTYTDKVVSFINEQKQSPFFIYLSHHIVHSPHRPSDPFKGSSEKGAYGDFIQELDHSTGRIMDALRAAGLEENTLVVFTSDNGPSPKGSAGGLSGGKFSTMEGGHRVPGIFYWPGQIPPGQNSNTLISSMDLLPLFCGVAGVEPPKDRKLDGSNIIDILQGKTTQSPHDFTYYYNGTNLQAIRKGKWKLHIPRTVADQPFWSEKGNKKKGYITLDEYVLNDLDNDLAEKVNVAAQYPEVVDLLKRQAEVIKEELGDVRVMGSDQRVPNLDNPQKRDMTKRRKNTK